MNIYDSLMDIFDEKNKNIYVEKNILWRKDKVLLYYLAI